MKLYKLFFDGLGVSADNHIIQFLQYDEKNIYKSGIRETGYLFFAVPFLMHSRLRITESINSSLFLNTYPDISILNI